MTPVELQDGEVVVHLSRRHWIVLYPLLVLDGLLGIVPLLLGIWVAGKTDGTLRLVIVGAAIVWALTMVVRGYFRYYRYHHDVWLVTNQRLVDSYSAALVSPAGGVG